MARSAHERAISTVLTALSSGFAFAQADASRITLHDNINIEAVPNGTDAVVLSQPSVEQSAGVKVVLRTVPSALVCQPIARCLHASSSLAPARSCGFGCHPGCDKMISLPVHRHITYTTRVRVMVLSLAQTEESSHTLPDEINNSDPKPAGIAGAVTLHPPAQQEVGQKEHRNAPKKFVVNLGRNRKVFESAQHYWSESVHTMFPAYSIACSMPRSRSKRLPLYVVPVGLNPRVGRNHL
jgi:hypothetical protein|eukprot:7376578-Prymnesium_polylepis.3